MLNINEIRSIGDLYENAMVDLDEGFVLTTVDNQFYLRILRIVVQKEPDGTLYFLVDMTEVDKDTGLTVFETHRIGC